MNAATLETRRASSLGGGVAAAADIIEVSIDMMTSTIERPDLDDTAGKMLRSLVIEAQWLAGELLAVAETLDAA